MQVVLRDPRHRKAGGRTAGRQPSSDPVTVVQVRGNQLTVKTQDGKILKDLRTEDALVIPEGARNFGKSH